MGLFDEVYVHPEMLPDDAPEVVRSSPNFQTYDLGRSMCEYTIYPSGLFVCDQGVELSELVHPERTKDEHMEYAALGHVRKKVTLYADNLRRSGPGKCGNYLHFTEDGSDFIQYIVNVQIRRGTVSSIKTHSLKQSPAYPVDQFPNLLRSSS